MNYKGLNIGKYISDIQKKRPEMTNRNICLWLSENYPDSSISVRNLQLIKSGSQPCPSVINAVALVNFINSFKDLNLPEVSVEELFDIQKNNSFYRQTHSEFRKEEPQELDDILKFIEEYENRK